VKSVGPRLRQAERAVVGGCTQLENIKSRSAVYDAIVSWHCPVQAVIVYSVSQKKSPPMVF